MEEKYFYVKMQDVLSEEVFHTIKLSQKQALGLGHSGYEGRSKDQKGDVWKWDAQKATYVMVKSHTEDSKTGYKSPLKPHIENQENEIERHVGALKQDIAEKKEKIEEPKKSFSDKYVPFRKKEESTEIDSAKAKDGEDIKVGHHLIGVHGPSGEAFYKVTKIEKDNGKFSYGDKIHTVNHEGEERIMSSGDINRPGKGIGVRTALGHEKEYGHKYDLPARFESEAKYHKEATEETEKHTKIAEGNIGKEVVFHHPQSEMHGKTGKIVGHKSNQFGTEYGIEVHGQVEGTHTNQRDFSGNSGWIEKNAYDAKFGKDAFNKAKSEHLDKQENQNKPHETNVKEMHQDIGQVKYNTKLIGPKGNYGVKINDNGWATFAEIHSDIHNVGKRGKHVKVQSLEIYKPKDSNAAHDLGLKHHLLKTNPQTHEDVVKEVENYAKNQGSDRVSNLKVGNKEDVRGIDTNEDFGQINHQTINLGHTKLVPNKRIGKVEVIDTKAKRSEDGSGTQYSFPISHYSRLEGIKGELSKTKSHDEVMKLLSDKKFKTSSFYYDPYR